MYPEICKIGPFTVYSYGLMLVTAFMVGAALAVVQARKQHIDTGIIFNFAFVCFISGIIGARILYILENGAYYFKNPLEIIMLQRGGLSWYGGLTLGSICGMIFLKKRNQPVYKLLDLIIPFVALAQAIGRIGCLLNGCCFGKISQFGIYFSLHKLTLIPTQIYSSILLLMIFIVLRLLQDRPHKEGQILFSYFLLYSIKRFWIEYWRADNEIIWAGLTLFQILSLVLLLISCLKLLSLRKSRS